MEHVSENGPTRLGPTGRFKQVDHSTFKEPRGSLFFLTIDQGSIEALEVSGPH